MRRFAVLFGLLLSSTLAADDVIRGLTFVNDDGTLRVDGKTIHLFGVYLPLADETCTRYERPPNCGAQSVLALQSRVRGFVHCEVRGPHPDGGQEAVCRVGAGPLSKGEDLAESLLRDGWAMARPEAPFEYQAQERLARNRGVGVWAVPIPGSSYRW